MQLKYIKVLQIIITQEKNYGKQHTMSKLKVTLINKTLKLVSNVLITLWDNEPCNNVTEIWQ